MDYGKKSKDTEYIVPGSPDARSPYRIDMYDKMKPMVTTKPNTGIQGDADSQTQNKSESVKSKGKTYRSDYNMGSGEGKGDEYDYAKGRKKKPMKSKRRG